MFSRSLCFRSLSFGASLAILAVGHSLTTPISPLPPGGPDVALAIA